MPARFAKLSRRGFTLIELLVVIAIIGLLSTLAVVSLNTARVKSRDTKRLADVRTMQSALELYASQDTTGKYPIASSWNTALDATSLATLLGPYLSSLPVPPQAANEYVYMRAADGSTYVLIAGSLEDAAGNASALAGDIDGNTAETVGVCDKGDGTACANKAAAQSCADPIYCLRN